MAYINVFNYPLKQEGFFRITDSMSVNYCWYGCESTSDHIGFDVGYSTQCLELHRRIIPCSVFLVLLYSASQRISDLSNRTMGTT
jgi:hypothetical protein